jgi:membrane protein
MRIRSHVDRWYAVSKDVVRGLAHAHAFHYSAGIAFRATLALFPLAVAGIVLLSMLGAGERAGDVVAKVGSSGAIPSQTANALRSQLNNLEAPGPGRVIGGIAALALALWSGATAFRTVMIALNEALDIDDPRPFRRRFAISFLLSMLTAVLVLTATLIVAAAPEIGERIRAIPGGSEGWFLAWRILHWPLVLGLVLVWLSITYAWGPGEHRRARAITPGKIIAFVGWLIFAIAFSWYVDVSNRHGSLYGIFAGLVALQIYVYWSSMIVLLGAQIDDVLGRDTAPTGADASA